MSTPGQNTDVAGLAQGGELRSLVRSSSLLLREAFGLSPMAGDCSVKSIQETIKI